MKSKDILLFVGGIAIGYLAFKKDLFKKRSNSIEKIKSGASDVVTGMTETIKDVVSDGFENTGGIKPSKESYCEKKWSVFAQTTKFASQESLEKTKQEFIANCMKG